MFFFNFNLKEVLYCQINFYTNSLPDNQNLSTTLSSKTELSLQNHEGLQVQSMIHTRFVGFVGIFTIYFSSLLIPPIGGP